MKKLLFIGLVSVFLSASCEDKKEQMEDILLPNGYVLGTVVDTYLDEGCSYLISIEEDGKPVLLMPIELDEEFHKAGKLIAFKYHTSRVTQDACKKGQPIVIDGVYRYDQEEEKK